MATPHRIWKLTAAAVAAVCLVAVDSRAATPPSNLHIVDGHWTAWDPPRELPEGARVHIIERGDTLWDLAERFFGDPYLWPQLWEGNRYILDAHWIYPGDPLVVEYGVTPIDEVAALGEAATRQEEAAVPQGPRVELGTFSAAPVPLGTEDDIYCSGFIGGVNEPLERTLIGSEFENLTPGLRPGEERRLRGQYGKIDTVKLELTNGDIVYLDGGEQAGLFPGTVYTVIKPGARVRHPLTGESMGRYYAYQGRVRVLSVQPETAIAEISQTCRPLRVGDKARLFEPVPVPLGRRTPGRGINDPVTREVLEKSPTIVLAEGGMVSLGKDHVVHIDRGAVDDVAPGDLYTVYRLNAPGLPPVVMGELAVLTVLPETAVGKIIDSRYSIRVGDRLDPKR